MALLFRTEEGTTSFLLDFCCSCF
uniref:Uncharacterized protein n=1 Tax=Anopheles arabiensis TaxID=7173 RepID=A0A182IEV7_ANOAR